MSEKTAINEDVDVWNDLVSQKLGRLDTLPVGRDVPFSGVIKHHVMDGLDLVELASTRLNVVRRKQFIIDESENYFKLNFHLAGMAELEQDGKSAVIQSGQWVLYDNTRPYTLRFREDYRQLVLAVPRQQLLRRFPQINQLTVAPQSLTSDLGKFALKLIQSGIQPNGVQANGLAQSEVVLDLITAVLLNNSPIDTTLSLTPQLTLARIKHFIQTHLQDPTLSVETIINAGNISKRYLHFLFEEEQTSVNNYIWGLRLEQAKLALHDSRFADWSVSDVGYAWGFNSSAHFSRRFKQAFGVSPSVHRKN